MQSDRMAPVSQIYKIDYHSLTVGKTYHYEFPIGDEFFALWPESEISKGTGIARVDLDRHASMMELRFSIDANVEITCDRCLEAFTLPVHYDGDLLVKISDMVPEDLEGGIDGTFDEDIMWLPAQENSLDLAQYIYESIMLSLPFQRVHPELTDCNPDMLERFRIVSQEEFDEMAQEQVAEGENPFAALADLQTEEETEE